MNLSRSGIAPETSSKLEIEAPTPQSIVISDINPVLAHGVQDLLQRDPFLSRYVIMVDSSRDLESLKELAPAILIIDPCQGPESWQASVNTYREISKSTSLICYCPDISAVETSAIGSVGFRGIMPKTIGSQELVRVVCAVAFGGIYLHDIYSEKQSSPITKLTSVAKVTPDLTERELEVLRHVALGSSMKEIAAVLNISTKTVDTYRTRANQKLNLRTRSDIVQFAIKSGWMT